MGETRVSRFLSAVGADLPSKGCLRSREREVGHATVKLAKNCCVKAIEKEVELTLSADTDQPCTESATSVSSTTNISGSIDAAWQCRGSGRSYKSLFGHSSVIGEKNWKGFEHCNQEEVLSLLRDS